MDDLEPELRAAFRQRLLPRGGSQLMGGRRGVSDEAVDVRLMRERGGRRSQRDRAGLLETRLHLAPQFRWKLVEVPFGKEMALVCCFLGE